MTHRLSVSRNHAMAGVFVFLLLGIFAVFSTMLVVVGAQAYRATATSSEQHSVERTIYAYLLNSIRGDDSRGIIEVETENGIEMVAVHYDFDGDEYIKRIYCWDGSLRELLTSTRYEFDPAKGEVLAAATDFHAELEGGLLNIEVTDTYGRTHTVQAVMRTVR